MRQIDYLLEGVRELNDVGDGSDGDICDEDIDAQFPDVLIAGREAGNPYNIKSVKVNQTEQPASI